MPLQQVGRFILTGTAEQNAKIVAAINECDVDLAKLIKKDIDKRLEASIEQAMKLLKFATERKMVHRAWSMLTARQGPPRPAAAQDNS